jgi:peptide/nickel transport system substrate-binding protein
VAALLAGEIDLAYNIPFEMARQIDGSRRASTKSVLTNTTYLLGMNALYPDWPTAKKEVRQAISYAVDRDELVRSIMGGLGAPVATLIHKNSWALNTDLKPRQRDVARAKQLLAQAGYPDGFRINMVASQGRWPKDREVAQAIASELADVGITVDLEILEYTSFTQAVHSKQRPMALWGWSDTENDPNTMLLRLYTCQDMGSPWSLNCMPELDSIAKAQQFEIEPAKREAMLKREQELMYDEEVNAALFMQGQIRGVSPKAADWYEPRADEGVWLFHTVKP